MCALPTGDCNDNNASIHPGATELCNLVDDNCNGYVDEGSQFDEDGDGWTKCAGDCNDHDARINGVEREYANASCFDQIDNDCDGLVDCDCALDPGDQHLLLAGTVTGTLGDMACYSPGRDYTVQENNQKRLTTFYTFYMPPPNAYSGTISYDLKVEGLRTPSTGNDSFNVYWANRTQTGKCTDLTGESYTLALTVGATDQGYRYRIGLPSTAAVSVCVKVVDTVQSKDTKVDTLVLHRAYFFPIPLDAKASSEETIVSTRLNGTTFLQTQALDGTTEQIQEAGSDQMIHRWKFLSVPIGSAHQLYIKGTRSSAENDNFEFWYATQNTDPMKPDQPGTFQKITNAIVNDVRRGTDAAFPFGPAGLVGTVWIEARDTVPGGTTLDRLNVDYLAIQTTP